MLPLLVQAGYGDRLVCDEVSQAHQASSGR